MQAKPSKDAASNELAAFMAQQFNQKRKINSVTAIITKNDKLIRDSKHHQKLVHQAKASDSNKAMFKAI